MTDEQPSYGDVAAGMLQRTQHGGPPLHIEIDPPPQPNWVTAVENVLAAAETWEQTLPGDTTEPRRQLLHALTELRKAWQ